MTFELICTQANLKCIRFHMRWCFQSAVQQKLVDAAV